MGGNPDVLTLVEEATLDYTLGDNQLALEKLDRALEVDRDSFEAWHAKTEIYFSDRRLDEALDAALQAQRIRPDDIHINTSLSRIWMERGDKEKAEQFGAQARMLGWKDQLKQPPAAPGADH